MPDFGRFLILYELADASVVDSPAYLERLNNPTPWSARMMPHLGNFIRGGGRIAATFGTGSGAALVPVPIGADNGCINSQDLEALSGTSGVVAVRMLKTNSNRTAVTSTERAMRTGDRSFQTLLLIEALDTEAAIGATEQLQPGLRDIVIQDAGPLQNPAYSLIFHLNG